LWLWLGAHKIFGEYDWISQNAKRFSAATIAPQRQVRYVTSQQGVSGRTGSDEYEISPVPSQVGQSVPSLQIPLPRQFGHFLVLKSGIQEVGCKKFVQQQRNENSNDKNGTLLCPSAGPKLRFRRELQIIKRIEQRSTTNNQEAKTFLGFRRMAFTRLQTQRRHGEKA
jgi:hypothetical protein